MDSSTTFERECQKAQALADARTSHSDYWRGYSRGLRRAHFGEQFGTEEQHQVWMALVASPNPANAARGRGYREGLAALQPS